jgi:hypothetical protein
MTFDLYAFPAPEPKTAAEAHQLLDAGDADEHLRFDTDSGQWLPRPGPQMVTFIDELQRRWPSLNDDPDGSPWSIWPLWQPTAGGGTGLNIGWSFAASVAPQLWRLPLATT